MIPAIFMLAISFLGMIRDIFSGILSFRVKIFPFCAILGAKSRKALEKSSYPVYNISATVPNGNRESANYFCLSGGIVE